MRKHFVAGVYHLRRLPLGGKLSPKVTDEGATGLPNGAEENFRWGDRREPPFSASTRKGWVQDRPLIRPSVRTVAPSPQGEGFGEVGAQRGGRGTITGPMSIP